MRKFLLLLLICVLLSGCAASEVFETLGPVLHQPENLPAMSTLQLTLPDTAIAETFGGSDKLYECDGYTLILQNLPAGDFSGTVRTLSGFWPQELTVLESGTAEIRRFDWVWTAMGESGQLVCRAAVLDDGNYHYCLTAVAPVANAGELSEQWNALFASLRLEDKS